LNGPEPQLAALFDVLVPADGVFLDVGSNWGYHAVAVAARPGFRGRVHAFEPVPATFRDMVAVVEQSGLTGRVTCHNIGLSDRDGAGTMVIPDGLHSGLASIRDESAGGLRVKLRPLAGLAGPDPDVIKLDVEGHELAALRGAEPVLRRARPMLTFEDWHRPDTAGPVDYLTELGYRLYLPAWWVHNQPIRPGHDLSPSDLTRLALVPLGPGQRDELAGREDLFACPVERMGELESRFGFTPIA
jgi:FkbM family methyltransferase